MNTPDRPYRHEFKYLVTDPLRVLLENGYRGYINTEYEGGRHTQGAYEVRGIEQVRRHQAMIRNYVTKYTR